MISIFTTSTSSCMSWDSICHWLSRCRSSSITTTIRQCICLWCPLCRQCSTTCSWRETRTCIICSTRSYPKPIIKCITRFRWCRQRLRPSTLNRGWVRFSQWHRSSIQIIIYFTCTFIPLCNNRYIIIYWTPIIWSHTESIIIIPSCKSISVFSWITWFCSCTTTIH